VGIFKRKGPKFEGDLTVNVRPGATRISPHSRSCHSIETQATGDAFAQIRDVAPHDSLKGDSITRADEWVRETIGYVM
jgi:hypothetical protein